MAKKKRSKKNNKKDKSNESINKEESINNEKSTNNNDEPELEERFRAAETRPHFRAPKEHSTKIVLDKRFESVLTDPRFQLESKDKYGRSKKSKQKDDLSAFYTIADDPNKAKKNKDIQNNKNYNKQDDDKDNNNNNNNDDDDKSTSSSSSSDEDKDELDDPASRIAYLTKFSRGELDVSSSSDDDSSQSSKDDNNDDGDEDNDDDDDDDDSEGEDPVHGTVGILDPSTKENEEIEITYDPSPFLVVMNMDWDNVRAIDLFAIIASFTSPGAVKHVQVYPSDFGKEQMEKEATYGPSGLWKNQNKKKEKQNKHNNITPFKDDDDDDNDDDDHADDDDSDVESLNQVNSDDNDFDEDSLSASSENDIDNNDTIIDQYPTFKEASKAESDFDPEKLRAYEASKLKYYFAIVEFSSPEQADVAYKEVDGLEFEHSSAAIDLRALPAEEVDHVIQDRKLRDEATCVPGNYIPPHFVVSALQQTTVQCTWDMGDRDRERTLTKYSNGGWQGEEDDLKAYLASDVSSDDDDEDDDDSDDSNAKRGKAKKGSKMRKLLGLDGSDDDDDDDDEANESDLDGASDSSSDDDENENAKEMTFIPGQKKLADKIRSNLKSKKEGEESRELTPWEKYQEKRRQKRSEKRRAARERRKGGETLQKSNTNDNDNDDDDDDDSSMDNNSNNNDIDNDDFFINDLDQKDNQGKKSKKSTPKQQTKSDKKTSSSSLANLELLLAGEEEEEQIRDYDIRGIQKLEKTKDKKLYGARKKKAQKLAESVSGTDFKVNVTDERFAAVLDGTDSRFGIDTTDPNYRDTSAMRDILAEQSRRRRNKRKRKSATNNNSDDSENKNNQESASTKTTTKSLKTSNIEESKSLTLSSTTTNNKKNDSQNFNSIVKKLKSRVTQ